MRWTALGVLTRRFSSPARLSRALSSVHVRGRLPGPDAAAPRRGSRRWQPGAIPASPEASRRSSAGSRSTSRPAGGSTPRRCRPARHPTSTSRSVPCARVPRNTIVGSVRGQGLYPGSTPFNTYATLFNARRQIIVVVTLDSSKGRLLTNFRDDVRRSSITVNLKIPGHISLIRFHAVVPRALAQGERQAPDLLHDAADLPGRAVSGPTPRRSATRTERATSHRSRLPARRVERAR